MRRVREVTNAETIDLKSKEVLTLNLLFVLCILT